MRRSCEPGTSAAESSELPDWCVEASNLRVYFNRFLFLFSFLQEAPDMGTKSDGFNLSEVIRQFRNAHRGVSAKITFEGIKKAHPSQKINEGTFKSTFYKLAGGGKRKVVRRRKPGRRAVGNRQPEH